MLTLNVPLADRSYPIYIGASLQLQELLAHHISHQQIMVVSNTTVAALHLAHFIAQLPTNAQIATCILPDGEQYKTLDSFSMILDSLMQARFARDCLVIALGGGVVGDITGFATASFQRGVDFLQVPTTLLSQVDSSVGGKTGINHALGKNMIGAFKQPIAVIIETNYLDTLSPRDYAAGLAEVIKYALIKDPDFLVWLENHISALNQKDKSALAQAIFRSCQHKANIVGIDELESGDRALLNLGHTFGHAIETAEGYGTYLHGEAVAIGMLMACDLSMRLGQLSHADVRRIRELLEAANLPVDVPQEMSPEDFLKFMMLDKKVKLGKMRLILLKAIGDAYITSDYAQSDLMATLAQKQPGI